MRESHWRHGLCGALGTDSDEAALDIISPAGRQDGVIVRQNVEKMLELIEDH